MKIRLLVQLAILLAVQTSRGASRPNESSQGDWKSRGSKENTDTNNGVTSNTSSTDDRPSGSIENRGFGGDTTRANPNNGSLDGSNGGVTPRNENSSNGNVGDSRITDRTSQHTNPENESPNETKQSNDSSGASPPDTVSSVSNENRSESIPKDRRPDTDPSKDDNSGNGSKNSTSDMLGSNTHRNGSEVDASLGNGKSQRSTSSEAPSGSKSNGNTSGDTSPSESGASKDAPGSKPPENGTSENGNNAGGKQNDGKENICDSGNSKPGSNHGDDDKPSGISLGGEIPSKNCSRGNWSDEKPREHGPHDHPNDIQLENPPVQNGERPGEHGDEGDARSCRPSKHHSRGGHRNHTPDRHPKGNPGSKGSGCGRKRCSRPHSNAPHCHRHGFTKPNCRKWKGKRPKNRCSGKCRLCARHRPCDNTKKP